MEIALFGGDPVVEPAMGLNDEFHGTILLEIHAISSLTVTHLRQIRQGRKPNLDLSWCCILEFSSIPL
jgi:hypothetical protein